MVAARMAPILAQVQHPPICQCRRGISSDNRGNTASMAALPRMPHLPPVPHIPPLWRESRFGLELAELRRSPVFRGHGVPRRRRAAR